jgi:hypothetical protein
MKLTDQQKAIVDSHGNIKINAVAGSGKTATLIEYAKKRAKNSRILYLGFNRSVRQEAERRFAEAGLDSVKSATAHSLAFSRTVAGTDKKVSSGYKTHELVSILDLKPPEKNIRSVYLLAAHIIKYASMFLSNAKPRVSDVDYAASICEPEAVKFLNRHYGIIQDSTRKFLAKMDSGAIPVTHDFYLKKFQLSAPVLNYDCILLDEGQDASPVILDIFLKQNAVKVIVGDAHQQIYAWRHAVNALGSVDFKEYGLTTSFRFPQRIADCAMECLLWKHYLYGDGYEPVTITGAGTPAKKVNSRATLARTNIFLLRNAVDLVCGATKPAKIYFEGNLSSYTYASEGASLWDVFSLFSNESEKIRDPLIKSMGSIDELEEYASEAEDAELGMLIDMVNEHGRKLPWYFKQIKEHHVPQEKRHTADMVLSTVHRCKGMEYDWVKLEEDFTNETQLKKISEKKDITQADKNRLEEEINLVYVAVTRTRNILGIPEKLFQFNPEGISTNISAEPPTVVKRGYSQTLSQQPVSASGSSDFLVRQRQKHPKAYRPWDFSEDALLTHLVQKKMPPKKIALQLNRSRGAILARIEKLELSN